MDKNICGKKLLILGGSCNELSLIHRARQLGAYVIVADYFDETVSIGKKIADEAWKADWTDVPLMVSLCKENKVDGIVAGYSEIKIDYLIRICEELGLPCYSTAEQLEITRDKVKFKNQCRASGVPTVKEYASVNEVDDFPVIVKPVDRGGSIGVSIANNHDELKEAYRYAMELSLKKEVIIEKYIGGLKVDAYYSVINGKIDLLTTNDTIMSGKNGTERVVQNGWLYPHKKVQSEFQKIDPKLRQMIRDMNIQDGCIFFSGFYDEKEPHYVFFECGFRMEGGHQYGYTERKGMYNFLDLFIYHALGLPFAGVKNPDGVNEDLKLVTLNFYAKTGTVAKIEGFDQVAAMPECTLSLVTAQVGEPCTEKHAILNKIGMVSFAEEDPIKLERCAANALRHIRVTDEDGNDMLYDRFDCSVISGWWD